MNAFSLRLELTTGMSTREACKYAVEYATKFDIPVVFNMNGIECTAFPRQDYRELLRTYLENL